MHFQLSTQSLATCLSLLLVMAVDSTRMITLCRNQQCGKSLMQTLKLTKLMRKESVDLIKTYKASQGDTSENFCTMHINNLPDPNISGLQTSDRILSIYTHLQAFGPHFKRVFEQQTDLQTHPSTLLSELTRASNRSNHLAAQVNCFYQGLYPNLPVPEPEAWPTSLPPPQNTFQQKVYGCVVLRRYKEFLINVSHELRIQKARKVCRIWTRMNVFF